MQNYPGLRYQTVNGTSGVYTFHKRKNIELQQNAGDAVNIAAFSTKNNESGQRTNNRNGRTRTINEDENKRLFTGIRSLFLSCAIRNRRCV
jgi:hypothetical protein